MADKKHGNWKHGGAVGYQHSRTYRIWIQMLARCQRPSNNIFEYYGGRGIKVCAQWSDFARFVADLGQAPENYTLERINNDGDYEPSNCRWATRQEQANNRRSNRLITHRGRTMTVAQWAKESGVRASTFKQRFYVYGWPIDRCLGSLERTGRRSLG